LSSAGKLGERKIIEILMTLFKKMPKMPIPFGDDVSAIDLGGGKLAVIKCDMLVARTDVPRGMNYRQAARKAVVSTVSDFAAKGIQPLGLLASLGLPYRLKRKDIVQIGLGLNAGAIEYDTYLLGGDTNEAEDLIIDCVGFGLSDEAKIMKRSGAKPGDLVATTGSFGKTAAGLKMIKDRLRAPRKTGRELVEAVYMPNAYLKEGLALARTRAATSCIDSSDGLAWSLYELARMSRVGFEITHIPVAPSAKNFAKFQKLDAAELALYGGEEYNLVFTLKPRDLAKVSEALDGAFFKIGRVTDRTEEIMLNTEGRVESIKRRGWEHFKHN
jgi:thiamine-monophosphate kinase